MTDPLAGQLNNEAPAPQITVLGEMNIKKLADWEENKWDDLIERAASKYPDSFWNDEVPDKGWELFLIKRWPRYLTIGYWYYIFSNLEGNSLYDDEFPNWINIPQWGEWRYLFFDWKGKWTGFKWAWIKLTDETKGRRLICRLRGHPKGEVYYNPGGFEPDHHCQTCGEGIG